MALKKSKLERERERKPTVYLAETLRKGEETWGLIKANELLSFEM